MTKKALRLLLAILGFSLTFLLPGPTSAHTSVAPFKDLKSYVEWMHKLHHNVPFDRDGAAFPIGGAKTLMKAQAAARVTRAATPGGMTAFRNIQVNQDRNPWPKAEIGAAVDPATGNWVVMTNDFRRNYDQMFFHVSTDKGKNWTDDAMVGGSDPFTGFIPSTFQSDPGVSFDGSGNSYLSTITGNLIFDSVSGYVNSDTEIDVAQGFAGGTYASLLPIPVDVQPCNGLLFTPGAFSCNATLDKPLITTDSDPSSPNFGTTYVYYTLFCNAPASGFCTDGSATVPAFQSAILEVHSPGAGMPFSAPALVSGSLLNAQFSGMVIDPAGTPHIFFDDFTNPMAINMWESTLVGSTWVVARQPTVSFVYHGLRNLNWAFRDAGAEAPGCSIHRFTAYCAFSANQVGNGRMEGTPDVYLATIAVATGSASSVVRVNNDPINDQKHHFFAWATATPAGTVYVGWYDDRHDAFNTKVDYFVGRSTDGGRSFPKQRAVNDVSFNPCTGFPGCGFFGDYTQLVSGPDGVVHAAWSDTRDAASMQVWSQTLDFDDF